MAIQIQSKEWFRKETIMSNWQIPPAGGQMESPNGLYLQTMNMTQVNERLKKNDLIIIPVGSTECHGAAQPLGEDTFLVTRDGRAGGPENGLHHRHADLVRFASLPPHGDAGDRRCSGGDPAGEHARHHHRALEHGIPQADLSSTATARRRSSPWRSISGRRSTRCRRS